MASISMVKEVSSVPTEDGSIAKMKTQHDDAMLEDTERYKAAKDHDIDFILENLRHTECSLLVEKTFDSNTLLHVAASLGHDQIVKAILSIEQRQKLLTAKNSSGDLPIHVAANAGHLSIVQHFVDSSHQCQDLLMAKNSNDDLPLHVAARAGHWDIVHCLFFSCQYQDHLTEKNSARSVESSKGQQRNKLASKILKERNKEGNTPLHLALIRKYEEVDENVKSKYNRVAEYLIESDPSVCNFSNEAGECPYSMAINANDRHLSDSEFMSSRSPPEKETNSQAPISADPSVCNYSNKAGECPNSMANDVRLSKLMSRKAPPERNTMFQAAICDDVEMEKQRTDSSTDSNDRCLSEFQLRRSPLEEEKEFQAAISGDAEWEKEITDSSTDSSTDTTVEGDRRNRKSKDRVTSMKGELYKAVKDQNFNYFIKKKEAQDLESSDLSEKTPELNTILHLAAASSDDDQFVEAILRIQMCQQFVKEKNSSGDLPLHVAASAGHLHIVKLLVEWSNKQSQDHSTRRPEREKNIKGNTPLHLALIKKFQVGRNLTLKAKYNEVARFLIENDPQVSYYPNKECESPLYMAAEAGDAELVKLMINTVPLLPYGKSIVHTAIYYLTTLINLKYGKSIVHTAIYGSFTKKNSSFLWPSMCLNTHTDILDTVLKSLPDDILAEKGNKGITPLFYAASIGYLEGVEIILENPTKCCAYDQRYKDGYYPIHIASRNGHIQVIKKFLDKYPDMIELLNEKGQNILHVAAMYGKAKVVAYLLKRHGLKVEMLINNEDEKGNTPLHLATKKGHPMVVSMLTWDKRVDLKSLNKEGKKALDIALNYSGESPSFRERLTWEALRYVSGPRAPDRPSSRKNPKSSEVGKTPSKEKYKDRTDTLLLVATLVATVTFAAAFTLPGGYKASDGTATFLEKPMFHVFVISNSIAMYSAITVVVALIWARLDDLDLFIAAYKFSVPILGLAITMVSLAFMAGNYLVLRDLNWLAYLLLSIGSFFLFTLSIIFFPLCLPNSSPHPIIRFILRYPFYLLIKFTGCDTDGRKEE